MHKENNSNKVKDSEVTKQNQDFPNMPVSNEKIKSGKKMEEQIKKTSKLHPDGKTDNTDKNNI